MMLGGMRLTSMTDEERRGQGIESAMALRATSVGKYGKHATARRIGFREGDIIVRYDGQNDFAREADLFAYGSANHKPGDKVEVEYLRDGKLRQATLPIQQ